ncbi:MAG: hypothetical protein FWC41_04715, partial [Firmicutes bacterium]|nr:hypothetical protein [Bacillota bacterium]
MKFKKKFKILYSLLAMLLIPSPFYRSVSCENTTKHNLTIKAEHKKSLSDKNILTCGFFTGATMLLLARYFWGGKNHVGNEISSDDKHEEVKDIRSLKADSNPKYLNVNIPIPKWFNQSCALDSAIMLLTDIIDPMFKLQDQYEITNNINQKKRFWGYSTETVGCLTIINDLLKDSRETGKKAEIHMKKGITEDKRDKRLNEICSWAYKDGMSVGDVLYMALGNRDSSMDANVFIKIMNIISNDLNHIVQVDSKKHCKDSNLYFDLLKFKVKNEEKNEENSVEFAYKECSYYKSWCSYEVAEKPPYKVNIDGKEFNLDKVAVYTGDYHYLVYVKLPNQHLSEELIEKEKWFIERDSLHNKDSRCLTENLVSYDDIKKNLTEYNAKKPTGLK